MLNVLVKQLELVALLSYFNAEQISHREHSYPAFSIDHGEMSTANQLHSFEGLVGCFIALNHCAQLAAHLSNSDCQRIALWNNNAIQDVTLGKNAEQSTVLLCLLALLTGAALTRFFRDPRTNRIINVSFAVLLIVSVIAALFV